MSLWQQLEISMLGVTFYNSDPQGSFLDNIYMCTKLEKNGESYHKFDIVWSGYLPLMSLQIQQHTAHHCVGMSYAFAQSSLCATLKAHVVVVVMRQFIL